MRTATVSTTHPLAIRHQVGLAWDLTALDTLDVLDAVPAQILGSGSDA